MATATPETPSTDVPPPAPARAEADGHVTMRNIGWRGYLTMLRLRGDRPRPKMIYLDGDLTLVSPAMFHERLNFRVGYFVDQVLLGLRIEHVHAGQTTFRWKPKRGGVEADRSYYIANEARVRGRIEIDFRVDPPPDLVIEVVHTHRADDALKVHRRLGVPEVWVLDETELFIRALRPSGRYARVASSLALPDLSAAEILGWMQVPWETSELTWMRDVQRWVAEVLAPRHRQRSDDPTRTP